MAGTVPEMEASQGLLELSMADVAGGGIVSGFALAGVKPIYVVRYQGFLWYNLVTIANYCAKSAYLWNRPVQYGFVPSAWRAPGSVAGNGHHSMATRMPGLNVIAPSTTSEYEYYFKEFLDTDKVFFVSEHRRLFRNEVDLSPIIENQSKIAMVGCFLHQN